MQITRKKIITLLVILVVSLLTYFLFFKGKNVYVYEFSKIEKGRVEKTIATRGELLVEKVLVNSKLSGIIDTIFVDVNQHVKKGQLLCTIRSEGLNQRIQKLKNSLDGANLEVEQAKKTFNAKKNMFKENLISKEGLSHAEVVYKTTVLKQKQIQLDYSIALKNKRDSRVYAQKNGVILAINVLPEQPIGVNYNIMQIAVNMKKMTLLISIDESDIGYIKKKQIVDFSVSAYPDLVFKGSIFQVQMNPIKSGGLVTYQSIVSCDNSSLKLKPGMTATATIIVQVKENVVRVPNQAFIVSPRDDVETIGANVIWVKNNLSVNGIPTKFNVEVGLRGDIYTEIKLDNKSKLKVGDNILVRAIKEDE